MVFNIGVLNNYEIAARVLQSGANRCPLTLVVFMADEREMGNVTKSLQQFSCAVSRAIIDNDDFLWYGRSKDLVDYCSDCFGFVINRNQNRGPASKLLLSCQRFMCSRF